MENVKYRICYWYHEYQDMSASVPTCDYYRQYGKCPCELGCEHFITKREVDDIVRNMGKIGQTGDLISREDVVNEIHKYFFEEINKIPCTKDEDGYEVYTDMPTVNSLLACNKELSKRIKALSSADAVQGVRCKDCRYFKKIAERSDSGLCHRDIVASAWKENGYCSRGERKGGDTE